MSEILDVINEQDEVIGQAERDEVHRMGLLCRLIYVCFYTPNGDIILQKRRLTKKNDPGKLTTAVSGHVAAGQTYLEAALRETFEETGMEIEASELINLGVVRADFAQGDYLSNAMRGLFAYEFKGKIEDLIVEESDGAGFISLPIHKLDLQLDTQPELFSTMLTSDAGRRFFASVRTLIGR